MQQRIAVVGMGQMGSGMAERLKGAGFDVIGYDVSDATTQRLTAAGFRMAGSIAEALADRDVVLTSLPNPAIVRDAWLGQGGVAASAKPGAIIIELSTIDPDTMREVAAPALERGVGVLDVPVSGSPAEAAQGKLVLMVGGETETVDRAAPVLKQLGATWKQTGGVGTAKVVKIVNNLMSMGNVLIAAEAFALGTTAGVDPETLYDVLSVSGGRSHHFTKRFPNALKGDFAPGFKMELGEKDLALGLELGRMVGMPTPGAKTVHEMYATALDRGLRGQDIVALLKMYQEMGGRAEEE